MKLHKLQILQYGTGPVSHCNTIAGCYFRVGGLAIKLTRPSGRQDCICRPDYLGIPEIIVTDNSYAFTLVVGEQINSIEIFQYSDIRILPDFFYECLCDYPPGFIAVGMSTATAPLAGERNRTSARDAGKGTRASG